jgi:hypothetical protein
MEDVVDLEGDRGMLEAWQDHFASSIQALFIM